MGFKEYEPSALRIPLRGEFGQAFAGVTGQARDDELELVRVALLSRLPARCPDDALGAVGGGLGLERYPADTDATYRAREVIAWPTRQEQGAPTSIEGQIRAFGIPDVYVARADEGNFGPNPLADYAEFWVFLGPDFGSTGIAELILGSFVLGSGITLGSTATRAQIVSIKRIILKWKSAHSYPVRIILLFGSGPILGLGVAGGAKPLTLGSFTLGGARTISWIIGRTMNDTLTTLGFTLGGYEI